MNINLNAPKTTEKKVNNKASLWGSYNKNVVDACMAKFAPSPAYIEQGEDAMVDLVGVGKKRLVKFTIHMELVAVPYKKKDGTESIQLVADTSQLHVGTFLGYRMDGMENKHAIYARGLNLAVSEIEEEEGKTAVEIALEKEKAKNAEMEKRLADMEKAFNEKLEKLMSTKA